MRRPVGVLLLVGMGVEMERWVVKTARMAEMVLLLVLPSLKARRGMLLCCLRSGWCWWV